MRVLAYLSLLGLSLAATVEETGSCVVNSGDAVSDAMDASLFIWAASKRCGKKGLEIKCEVDVTSAIKSLQSMVNVILTTVDQCEGLNAWNKQCILQSGKTTEHLTGLMAASGEVAQKCANNKAAANGAGEAAAPVMCSMNLKDVTKNIFKVVNDFQNTKQDCDGSDDRRCAANALHVAGAFSAIGQYLAGTVGQCKRAADASKKTTKSNLCAQASLALIEYLTKVSADGILMSQKCVPRFIESDESSSPPAGAVDVSVQMPGAGRLYEGGRGEKQGETSLNINLMLGAFVPVAAVFGFIGGRRARRQNVEARDVLSDHE